MIAGRSSMSSVLSGKLGNSVKSEIVFRSGRNKRSKSCKSLFSSRKRSCNNLVDASSKRHDELEAAQRAETNNKIANDDGIETGWGLNQLSSLQHTGDTRWSSHLNSINSIHRLYNATGKVLQTIIEDRNRSQRSEADASFDTLKSYEFVFILHLMKKLLALSDNLCQALQRRTQDVVNAMDLVSTTKELIQNFRDNGWNDLLVKIDSLCEKNGVQIPDMTAPYTAGKGRSRLPINITLEHHYRVDFFIAATDSQLREINNRFDVQMIDLLSLSSALDPKDSYMSFDVDKICLLVSEHYPQNFST
ncbi:hypothetical protein BVRB_9g207040 [Beta vulgaris subsp. vulgaris]|uniref:DUF4371 domain-containing protein n=1 Tax=Beta vulgaris subsp. vulgaris TaxID=3555 RepID=A0A0J8BQF1_BETVV|nr:hypothetical protein BVRB_9g207040 [Beta vulgaris subsp. vulgaris]